jgi:hypothetical protein
MLGKGNQPKRAGIFDYDPVADKRVAPTREIMFASTDESNAQMLTPREVIAQAERLIALGREMKMIVGTWTEDRPYRSVMSQIQSLIADNNVDTRRDRRKAKFAIIDAKNAAKPKFGREHVKAVDSAA